MRRRFPRRGTRSGRPDDHTEQPGFPSGEARLLDVRQESSSVFLALDDGSTLEVAADAVPDSLPEPGRVLPPELLADLRLAAERKLVARWIFGVLDRRLQPVARIRDKAAEKGYSKAAVDGVLEQMAARGLYSDRNFAQAYCRDCLASRAVGRRYLVSKLREKKVPVPLATKVAREILDPMTEEDLAERAATARWRRIKEPGDRNTLAKVVRFLQGRGFEAGLANRAARKTQPPTGGGHR